MLLVGRWRGRICAARRRAASVGVGAGAGGRGRGHSNITTSDRIVGPFNRGGRSHRGAARARWRLLATRSRVGAALQIILQATERGGGASGGGGGGGGCVGRVGAAAVELIAWLGWGTIAMCFLCDYQGGSG